MKEISLKNFCYSFTILLLTVQHVTCGRASSGGENSSCHVRKPWQLAELQKLADVDRSCRLNTLDARPETLRAVTLNLTDPCKLVNLTTFAPTRR